MNNQQPEIPLIDYPYEVSPVDRPEVEIVNPHPLPSEPGAEAAVQPSAPIGFTAK